MHIFVAKFPNWFFEILLLLRFGHRVSSLFETAWAEAATNVQGHEKGTEHLIGLDKRDLY